MDHALAGGSNFFEDTDFWCKRTPVHEAASLGQVVQLQQLIDAGASVNAATVDNITPLHDACINDHPKCVGVLLNAGAQVDVRNIHGSTPLCHACAAGSVESVKLLLAHGASVNPSLTALTASPLHEACICGNPECVKLILSKGALLEAFDIHFGTPLHAACAKAHLKCALLLLNAGARVNATKFHETALHHAARVQRPDLIELLVEFGGDINVRDNLGHRPIDYTVPGSSAYICLQHYETCPLSLQHLSRIAIRTVLGTRALQVVTKLNMSHRLISYLCYK